MEYDLRAGAIHTIVLKFVIEHDIVFYRKLIAVRAHFKCPEPCIFLSATLEHRVTARGFGRCHFSIWLFCGFRFFAHSIIVMNDVEK